MTTPSRGWKEQSGKDPDHCGLARTVGTQYSEDLPRSDLETYAIKSNDLVLFTLEDPPQILHFDLCVNTLGIHGESSLSILVVAPRPI